MESIHVFKDPPRSFNIAFPQGEIADLRSRLAAARWPDVEIVPEVEATPEDTPSFSLGWGPTLPVMKELCEGWKEYSIEKELDHINTFAHFSVEIEDLNIHFIHHRSDSPTAIPLILIHGWPGSFLEFLGVIPLLTHPGEGKQAFHVVVPSQPGFAFSSPPRMSPWVMDNTARVFDKLMTGLGYSTYAAQGGDWGSVTARCLGALFPSHCLAVHLNFCPASGTSGLLSLIPSRTLLNWTPRWLLSDLDRQRLLRGLRFSEKFSAYYVIQHLTPRTPAYGLTDSPVGTLAWLGEKMLPSINCNKALANPSMNLNTLFATCTLYYLTKSIGTSFLPYTHNPHLTFFLSSPKYFLPNFGMSGFPNEIVLVPVRNVAQTGNLRWYKGAFKIARLWSRVGHTSDFIYSGALEAEDGGHYAAAEQPNVFSEHLAEAFAELWPKTS